ncbi:unnamed protein product [Meloidogyne enterolobii]|uniref:Uncharacterized protein n=2 Tax=Meloidogyne enterolobii TaxID=390850 RepID=A0ACB1B5M7_MELEN
MFLFNNLNNVKTLKERNWQTIIYKQIPLFLYINEPEQEFAIRLIKKGFSFLIFCGRGGGLIFF